jgi:transposase-like protein
MFQQPFNVDEALKALQSGKDLTDNNGVLMPLIKQLTEALMSTELDHHLSSTEESNRKNGKGFKTIKTGSGSFELNAARDRAGTFEPPLIK